MADASIMSGEDSRLPSNLGRIVRRVSCVGKRLVENVRMESVNGGARIMRSVSMRWVST